MGGGIHDLAIHFELVAGHIDGELIVADLLDLTFGGAGGLLRRSTALMRATISLVSKGLTT